MVVLVIDSNPAELMKTAQTIQSVYAEADVLAFDDGMDAVQYGFNHPVDAVYSAVMLPHLTGFDVARLLRKQTPGLAAFVFDDSEAYAGRAHREQLGFFRKPLAEEAVRRFRIETAERLNQRHSTG